jgi:hypothetical protein
MFRIKVAEKIKTHFVFSKFFIKKTCRLRDNVEKYSRGVRATDKNMAHAHCTLDT